MAAREVFIGGSPTVYYVSLSVICNIDKLWSGDKYFCVKSNISKMQVGNLGVWCDICSGFINLFDHPC